MPEAFSWSFVPRQGLVEGWDPRAKLLGTLLVGIALVVHHDPVWKGIQVAALGVLWLSTRLGWPGLFRMALVLAPLEVTTVLSQLMVPGPGPGWVRGLTLDLQIFGVVLVLTLLVRTTSPTALVEGLERWLKPLERWRVPVHEAVLMFSIALRFIPLLLEEFQAISRAQQSRGGGFVHGGVVSRVARLPALVVPLFVSAILRAQALGEAMESRGYRGAEGRTPLTPQRWSARDIGVVGVAVAILVVSVYFMVFPGPGAW